MTVQDHVAMMTDGDAVYLGLRQVDKTLWLNHRHVSVVRVGTLPNGDDEVSIHLLGGQTYHVRRSLRDVLACLSGSETYRSQCEADQ